MKALYIGMSNVRRMFRDRSNIFFVFIFPIALILLIGAQFGGGVLPFMGVYAEDDGRISQGVVAGIEEVDSFNTLTYDDWDSTVRAVERGEISIGVRIPAGLDESAAAGALVEIDAVARSDGFGAQVASVVGSVLADVMRPVGAARFAAAETGAGFSEAFEVAVEVAASDPGVDVSLRSVGELEFPITMGRFDLGASQQLILFMFITGLSGGSALIMSRELGVSRRMLSSPTSVRTILLGESFGRFGVALVQGLYIVGVTLLAFGVNWGDPLGAIAVLVVFAAVAAGSAMLIGSVLENSQQAGGIAVVAALGLAALGGAMVPVEQFPATMQQVAMFTPHYWAIDALAELIRRDGTLVDILPQLGILAGLAAVLLALATWRLRLAITRV